MKILQMSSVEPSWQMKHEERSSEMKRMFSMVVQGAIVILGHNNVIYNENDHLTTRTSLSRYETSLGEGDLRV